MGSIHTQMLPNALAAGAPPQTLQYRGRAPSALVSLKRRVENGVQANKRWWLGLRLRTRPPPPSSKGDRLRRLPV